MILAALPYAAATAATEALPALAVHYGPRGIRVNAVALGSISIDRYRAFLTVCRPNTRLSG
jgi:NAD(P)-dependent dehydrogenase (short-subunit alcohol dehydrogenase family)